MDYSAETGMVGSSMLGGPQGEIRSKAPELVRVTDQINAAIERLGAACSELGQHADRVFGEQPTESGCANAAPIRSGAMGSLEDAADRLDYAVERVREATRRNCKLA